MSRGVATWLVIDTPYLCYRAFYAGVGRELSHKGKPTGLLYGVLRDIVHLKEIHATEFIVFCFDNGRSKREEVLSTYKKTRRDRLLTNENWVETYQKIKQQTLQLRDKILPDLGYRNIFHEKGYEADDMIASVCKMAGPADEIVIVSADHDLYQLLSPYVCIWNPGKKSAYTEKSFREEFGIPPEEWSTVKAIAGCRTDGILGVKGVGEYTACQFITNKLGTNTKAYKAIINARDRGQNLFNFELVRLPYPGTPEFDWVPDRVTRQKWDKVIRRLGMDSLEDRFNPM